MIWLFLYVHLLDDTASAQIGQTEQKKTGSIGHLLLPVKTVVLLTCFPAQHMCAHPGLWAKPEKSGVEK